MKKRKLIKFLNNQIAQNRAWSTMGRSYDQGIRDGRIEMAEYVIEELETKKEVCHCKQ